jgi:hypothetical protein
MGTYKSRFTLTITQDVEIEANSVQMAVIKAGYPSELVPDINHCCFHLGADKPCRGEWKVINQDIVTIHKNGLGDLSEDGKERYGL